jgi:antitoxin CcdA
MRMKHDPISSGVRKPVNLTLDSGIVEAAREVGVNLSRVSENAIREAAGKERARRWKEENREALQSWARWMEANGSPLDRHRPF